MDPKLLTWNVRGLGNRDKRISICKGVGGLNPDILVLQVSKNEQITRSMVKEVWGRDSNYWVALPSRGASGGILMIWNKNRIEMLEHEVGAFSISIRCRMVDDVVEWVFSGVYGPVLEEEVDDFFGELDDVKA